MGKKENIAVVILAAGESSRMKQTKQLLPWGKSTLLGNAIKEALESNVENVYVVLGAKAETIEMKLGNPDVDLIINKDWKKGMGSSISCAVSYLLHLKTSYDGILVMLCDQPLIDTVYLNQLIHAYRKTNKGIVATAYKDRYGVPALFDRKYFSKLKGLKKAHGAKDIIETHEHDILALETNGKTTDIDTLKEYRNLIYKLGRVNTS